ncbi:MAG TPA: MmcQ/YjbR family DNA-binding protein [Acidimicrobiales bacterium]
MANLARVEAIVARLPETVRVDIEAWGGEPTFRVAGKNFVFADHAGLRLTLKLSREESSAVVATDSLVAPAAYGLGRSGWVTIQVRARTSAARWREIDEWIRTSYTLVAPSRLARRVLEEDSLRDR